MEYKKIENPSYNLHLIKTDKFKTILFKFVFQDEMKKEEITIRNFLFDILLFSSKKYPTKKEMTVKTQELYDLNVFAKNRKIGNHFVSSVSTFVLEPKYIDEDVIEESLDFINEIIFNPNISNKCFDNDTFNIIKNRLRSDILSSKEYPKYYAGLRLKELMDDDMPFSYNMDGYIEDLEKITPSNLVEYYNNFLKNNLVDIYVIGNIDFYEMEKTINKIFKFYTVKPLKSNILINYKNGKKKINKIEEESNSNQSRLMIGYSLNKLTDIERKYTMFIYSIILGSSPDSRLFKNVREQKSLTYDIDSSYSKNDNIFIISTGLMKKNFKLAMKAINEEKKSIEKGNISEVELNNAKELIISSINEFEEYQTSIGEYYFSMEYLNIDNIETAIKIINSISKEDVVNVSKKVKVDTIYLLKEANNENN